MSFKKLAASVLTYQLACCCCWFFFRICSSQRVDCAIRGAQHDPANYENPKQFNPWYHGQVHHSFYHPMRRNLHSTAQRID